VITHSALAHIPQFVINLLHWLAQYRSEFSFNWQLADLAEMNLTYDIDNRTAELAARLIFEMVKAKFS
jgi:formiminoglutamase